MGMLPEAIIVALTKGKVKPYTACGCKEDDLVNYIKHKMPGLLLSNCHQLSVM